jgi:dTDP-glucose pyrophosphorylase
MKQIAPVDEYGHILMDYSIYDAKRAGFETVVCVIKKENEPEFRSVIGDRISKHIDLKYSFQSLDLLPEGYIAPVGRVKPWGTAHAVLSAKDNVKGNFSAINADDYYGVNVFKIMADFLNTGADNTSHAMVGYSIENTVTENGHVARGVCKTDESGNLLEIKERVHIVPRDGGAAYLEDGENYVFLPGGTIVSLNMWGFGYSIMGEIENRFELFLKEELPLNPFKCEYFLPSIPDSLIKEGQAKVKVLPTSDKWYGVTYAEDMPAVKAALKELRKTQYPERLWETP